MANTYKLIAKSILSSGTSNVSFSSIPATYTDLHLLITARTNYAVDNQDPIKITINGNSSAYYDAAIYDYQAGSMYATVNTANAHFLSFSSQTQNNPSNYFALIDIYFPNYSSTSYGKVAQSYFATNNTNLSNVFILGSQAFYHNTTSAISTISLTPQNGTNFVTNSSFYLYGIGA